MTETKTEHPLVRPDAGLAPHEADRLKRIAAAKARIEAAKEARANHHAEVEAATEADRLERQAEDAEALDAAERKHGPRRVIGVDTDEGLIIVQAPDPTAYQLWQDTTKEMNNQTIKDLYWPCIVYPDRKKDNGARVESILRKLPATGQRLADAVTVLAGYRKEDFAKKP